MAYVGRHLFIQRDIDLLTTGQTVVIPSETGGRFYAFQIFIELTDKTGATIVTPIVRIGNNGSFDNLVSLYTLTNLTAVNKLEQPTLLITDSIDIGSTGISIDVQTAGTGSTVLKCQVIIEGVIL
jgi:hypothetical protein